jgi:hypothetical protein
VVGARAPSRERGPARSVRSGSRRNGLAFGRWSSRKSFRFWTVEHHEWTRIEGLSGCTKTPSLCRRMPFAGFGDALPPLVKQKGA